MKTKIVLLAVLALTLNTLQAQPPDAPNPPPGAPPQAAPGTPGNPGNFHPMPPQFRGRQSPVFRQALGILRRAKMELSRSQQDYDGHRQSAMDACDKAMQELQAVVQAQAAAAHAAPPVGAPGNQVVPAAPPSGAVPPPQASPQ